MGSRLKVPLVPTPQNLEKSADISEVF